MITFEIPEDTSDYLRINELKNYLYCPRISYYALCLDVDRETGLSHMGIEAEAEVKSKIKRRKHALHTMMDGERHLSVQVASPMYRLIGKIDEVVETIEGLYLVDYKDTDKDFGYWQIQMCAYQLCIQDFYPVLGCYIYSLPTQEYHPVKLTERHHKQLDTILSALDRMIHEEVCPPAVDQIGKCRVCQYAKFCNDIF